MMSSIGKLGRAKADVQRKSVNQQPGRAMLRTLRIHLRFILVVGALAVVMTWPVAVYVFESDTFWLPSRSPDVFVEIWNAWYGQRLVTGQADFYFADLSFYPQGLPLTYHHFSIPSMLALGGLSALMPISNAYCLASLLWIVLNAGSAYVCLLHLFKDKWLALLGAIIFGFGRITAYFFSDFSLTFLPTLPLAFLFLHRGIIENRWKHLVISGILAGLTAWSSLYTFTCLMLTLAMGILVFARSRWRDPNFWLRILLLLALAGIISIIRIYPMMADSQALNAVLETSLSVEKGNELLAFFINHQHPTAQRVFSDLNISLDISSARSYLGWLPLILIGLGLSRSACRRRMLPWLILLLTFLILKLGSFPKINGQIFFDMPLPKYYLNEFAVFEAFYVSDYFGIGALLPLAILTCYGIKTALKSVPAKHRPPLILLAAALIAFEYYSALEPRIITDERIAYIQWLGEQDDQDSIRLINLPMGQSHARHYQFFQTLSGYPIVEGFTNRTPPGAYAYIQNNPLLKAWREHEPVKCAPESQADWLAALDDLDKDGFSHVVFHRRRYDADRVEDSFQNARPSYQNKRDAVYTLEDLRQSCP